MDRNNLTRKAEGGSRRIASSFLARRSSRRETRRGVLLLVVLSMLVLFMLVGTTFLMTSGQSSKSFVNQAKQNRVGNYGTKLLDRALLEVLRDTDNVNSAVRYHSLLRDVYGTDGFQGVIYRPGSVDLSRVAAGEFAYQPTTYAGITSIAATQPPLGPTQGQFIDIYVRALGWDTANNRSIDDPLTTAVNEGNVGGQLLSYDLRHVLKLERNVYGQPQLHTLPLTKGYYNGCLFTITSGAASGQSARILDYEYIADLPPVPATPTPSRLFRFRVMAFQRADGQPLQIDSSRSPEISDIAGATFIVNGRAYGGTGAGYNPLAANGQPKLNALQTLLSGAGAEIALLPNSTQFNALDPNRNIAAINLATATPIAIADPFRAPLLASDISPLNRPATPIFFNYPTFVGPGGVNESYDAPDFQNIWLALQTVTPRAQGRVVQSNGTFSAVDPGLNPSEFLRLDLEDLPLPSFHRPDLTNFWYHRLLNSDWLTAAISDPNQRARAILGDVSGVTPQIAGQIADVKRRFMMRPLREDHPNFDGSNPMSVASGFPTTLTVKTGTDSISGNDIFGITAPYWEAVGPWDVDNDNDGVPDSIWVDLGDAVQEAEDGTRYKPLYAFLIIDMDSRLNVNAHGLADDVLPPALDNTKNAFFDRSYNPNPASWMGNLAHTAGSPIYSSLQLARGSGYGPAEISLRSIFRAPLDPTFSPTYGNRDENLGPVDSLASLMAGRVRQNGTTVDGKYGFNPNTSSPTLGDAATAGPNYRFILDTSPASMTGETAVPSLAAQLKFFDYPWSLNQRSAFGTPPDLKGRYATGLDYIGQPAYEVVNDPNPNNTTLYFNLLAKSPYELDLSHSQRRDSWATGANSSIADTATAFNTSLTQNDDAPFSTTDLERILRAEDADSGTLPSRLWDVVNDFDPQKLMVFDPNRVRQASTLVFSSTTDPELLTTAQQIASINRRNVTTDSFSMPVVGKQVPSYIPELGVDGLPGRAGIDDNNNSAIDDASEIGAPGSDDFQALTGTKYSEGTLIDVVRYRIQRDRISRGIAPYDLTVPAQKLAFDSFTSQLIQQCMSADLMSGIQMDLNRPFGDGRDNPNPFTGALDGVVDDPMEAGEPFLDTNGNGKRDDGTVAPAERFINLDGSVDGSGRPTYTPPSDQLWVGLTSEPVTFDYTNGVAVPVHARVNAAVGPIAGGVRNLESQGRQLYARQLYCLMLLLTDENYVAPWDENDPQVVTVMESTRIAIEKVLTGAPYNQSPTVAKANANLIVARKFTCRQIAQWAINCADMRDSDVIMTPFEYDENPWDGWGVWDDKEISDPTTATFIPIDGDAATDENKAEVIDWANIPLIGGAKVTKQLAVNDGSPVSASNPAIVSNILNQTRGVVWGAERPELLITETLALHDRRAEDLISNDPDGHGEMKHYNTDRPPRSTGRGNIQDQFPDQGLRPRGSLFVEVYNPWSSTGQYPAELYSRVNSSVPPTAANRLVASNGVLLDRVSSYAMDINGNLTLAESNAASGIKRSPVWRLIVVEEWPDSRNSDKIDDQRLDKINPQSGAPYTFPAPNEPAAYKKLATDILNWQPTPTTPTAPFRPSDPDFDAAFNVGFLPTQRGIGKNEFNVQYPYIEREFYFTTDRSPPVLAATLAAQKDQTPDYDYSDASFKLRIPYSTVKIQYPPSITNMKPGSIQRFIPQQLELDPSVAATQSVIAPILPGRYGVIGSSGTKYTVADQTYTTTVGRFDVGTSSWNTDDPLHNPLQTRRIELRPSNDPTKQQVVVATNGGDPKDTNNPSVDSMGTRQFDTVTKDLGRDNELINDQGTVKNIYLKSDGTPGSDFFEPSVSIPVEGMNVSEPAWGWGAREYEAASNEAKWKGASAPTMFSFKPDLANKYEGRYFSSTGSKTSYNFEFDGSLDPNDKLVARELKRSGTTANYRTLHLQRLANPNLPWNPYPGQYFDATGRNDLHKPNMPVNPYRTVDTSSVDLTAFNGVSSAEANYPVAATNAQKALFQKRPWEMSEVNDYLTSYQADSQVFHFRSNERGSWSRLNRIGAAASPATSPLQRLLWAQEPAMVKFKGRGFTDMFYLLNGRQMSMRATEVDLNTTPPPGSPPLMKLNRADMVFEHTLGFGNKSFGKLYTRPKNPAAIQPGEAPTAAAVGAPAPGDYEWDLDSTNPAVDVKIPVSSTNPWLTWNNRPYVSAEELLTVPSGSQSKMLQLYSIGGATNSYDGTGIDPATGKPLANAARLAAERVPFGQLLNFMQTAAFPAISGPDTTDVDADSDKEETIATGAPNFYRILDFVQVPSRYVGTDTMLNAETFNDAQVTATFPTEPVGSDLTGPTDPRYAFQPPFNKVSRQRDPGRVNLNTVAGRRGVNPTTGRLEIWSDVFDGIMHREHDQNTANHLGHFGPAWRDVVLSRRGYAQIDAQGTSVEKPPTATSPDTFQFGLNNNFPTFFANPFRSAEAADLVPIPQMVQYGVDATLLRKHPWDRGNRNGTWGGTAAIYGDARDAGFGNDAVSFGSPAPTTPTSPAKAASGTIPSDGLAARDRLPLFSEARGNTFADTDRNPSMMYQPMTRLGNLVTDRSGVFGIWITVGYFEVEKADDWATNENNVQARFGGDINLYNRTYPDGYRLGRELGSDTGDVKRPRGFYMIDRTEEVGFKPGEDLNVEKTIRLRRRIQ